MNSCAGMPIVFFSTVSYTDLWQRHQQLFAEVCRQGRRSIYVGYGSLGHRVARLARGRCAERVQADRLVYDLHVRLPQRIQSTMLKSIEARLVRRSLRRILRQHHIEEQETTVVVSDVSTAAALFDMSWACRCLDIVDDFEHFPGASAAAFRSHTMASLRKADIVFFTARELITKYSPLLAARGERCRHVANGAADVPAQVGEPIPSDVLFVGAIADWLDFELIGHIVRQNPDMQFRFVGPVQGERARASLSRLSAFGNVTCSGKVPYDQVWRYIVGTRVGIIPFDCRQELVHHVDPIKIYEYFSMGKPVVVTDWREVRRHGDYCTIARSPEEFEAAIRSAINQSDDEGVAKRLRAYAASNSWACRAHEMLGAIEAHSL